MRALGRWASVMAIGLLLGGTVVRAQGQVASAPRNVRASVASSTLTLSWDAPLTGGPIYYYVIDIGQQPGIYDASVPIGLLTQVSAEVDDGVYYLRVRAVNAAGEGTPSLEVAAGVGVGAGLPGAPQHLAAGVTPNLLTLTWDPPTDGLPLTGYMLYAGTFPGTANALRQPIGSTTPTVSLPLNNVPAGTYFLRVAAVNAFGEGPVGNEVSITLATGGPPSAPRNLVANLVSGVVMLTWDPPAVGAPIVNYVVHISLYAGGSDYRAGTGGATSFNAPVGTNVGTYYFHITAFNSFGQGAASTEVSIRVGPNLPPGAPQSPVATVAAGVVTFTWLAPAVGAPILNYVVTVSTYPGGSGIRIGYPTTTTVSVPIGTTVPGTYYFTVRAVNAFGEGPPSADASVTIGPGSPPLAPLAFQAVIVNDVLFTTWYPPYAGYIPPTAQFLYVGTAPGASNVLRVSLDGVTGSYTANVAGATPGIYYLRVTAANAFGEGPPSNEVSVVVGCAVPSAPVLTGSNAGTTVSLSWSTPAGGPITGYTLRVAAGAGPFQDFASVGPVNSASGTASPGTYRVRVAANAACGLGAESNTVTITVP